MANELSIAQAFGLIEPDKDALDLIAFACEKMAGQEVRRVGPDELDTTHTFTPGLYSRTVHIRGPCLLASRVHHTEHQWVISLGEHYVWMPGGGVVAQVAGEMGVTKPGTFRLVFIPVEIRYSTFHATELKDPDDIIASITNEPLFLR